MQSLLDSKSLATAPDNPSSQRSTLPAIQMDWRRDARISAYTYVLFDGEPSETERQHYAVRLSHRYTLDYAVNPSAATDAVYVPFTNILHASCVEGGCVVAHELGGIEHIGNYLETSVRPAYLPLAIVSFHEYRHLTQLTQISVEYSFEGKRSSHQARALSHLVDELAEFKLYFCFSQASQVSHQNAVHALWRHAYQLKSLLEESTGDVAQAHAVLSERRWRSYGTLATFFGAYLTLTSGVDIFLNTVLGHEDLLRLSQIQAFKEVITLRQFDAIQHVVLAQQRFGHVAALVVAAFVAWLVYRKAPHWQMLRARLVSVGRRMSLGLPFRGRECAELSNLLPTSTASPLRSPRSKRQLRNGRRSHGPRSRGTTCLPGCCG